jgi:hypothetical protein
MAVFVELLRRLPETRSIRQDVTMTMTPSIVTTAEPFLPSTGVLERWTTSLSAEGFSITEGSGIREDHSPTQIRTYRPGFAA